MPAASIEPAPCLEQVCARSAGSFYRAAPCSRVAPLETTATTARDSANSARKARPEYAREKGRGYRPMDSALGLALVDLLETGFLEGVFEHGSRIFVGVLLLAAHGATEAAVQIGM